MASPFHAAVDCRYFGRNLGSYNHHERDFALQLAADLKNAGVPLWMDTLDGIHAGDDWRRTLANAIDTSVAMIAVLSPDYVTAKYCLRELARADELDCPIFPVLLRPLAQQDKPMEVQRTQYVDFCQWSNSALYRHGIDELLKQLSQQTATQLLAQPNIETRYLTSLIAELEARKGVLEYVDLEGRSGTTLDPNVSTRPDPHPVGEWGLDSEFALLAPSQVQRKTILTSILQVVHGHPSFVLIGEPGAGKTTALRRLALGMARNRLTYPPKGPLPLLLFLPAWTKEDSPLEFIKSHWPFTTDPAPQLVKGEVVLLLDGLNEMGAEGLQKAKLLREWLRAKQRPRSVIVTCREADYGPTLDLSLPTVVVQQLDAPRIRQFATTYLQAAAPAFLEIILPHTALDRHDTTHLSRLARNPYLLTALMLVSKNMREQNLPLPRNSGALFRRLAQVLWEREQGRQTQGWLPFEQMEKAFSQLAFVMLHEGRPVEVSRNWAVDQLGLRGRRGEKEALLWAANSANLVLLQGERVRFYHQLVQEYFAAVSLMTMRPSHIAKLLKQSRQTHSQGDPYEWVSRTDRWNPVIINLSGLLSNPEMLLQHLLGFDAFLAVECLASGISASEATSQAIIANMLTRLREGSDMPWRTGQLPWRTGQLLGRIGHLAVPGLLEALCDRSVPSSARAQAVRGLREVRDPSTIPALQQALTDPDEEVRFHAGLALQEMKGLNSLAEFEAALLEGNVSARRHAAQKLPAFGEAAIPALLKALRDEDLYVSYFAESSLGAIGGAAIPGWIDALLDSNPEVRRMAANALGELHAVAAIPELIRLLSDTEPLPHRSEVERVSDFAADALVKIGTPEALAAVHRSRSNPSGRDTTPGEQ